MEKDFQIKLETEELCLHSTCDIKSEEILTIKEEVPEVDCDSTNFRPVTPVFIKSEEDLDPEPNSTISYSYPHCNPHFSQKETRDAHVAQENGSKQSTLPYQCTLCKKDFAYKCDFTRHLAVHSEQKQFQCDQCEKSYKTKSALKYHVEGAHKGKVFSCEQCKKKFLRENSYKEHINEEHKEVHRCRFCDRKFSLASNLKKHLHCHSQVKLYQCDQCDKSYKTNAHLKDHVEAIHNMVKYPCDHCGRFFKTTANLKRHLKKAANLKSMKNRKLKKNTN